MTNRKGQTLNVLTLIFLTCISCSVRSPQHIDSAQVTNSKSSSAESNAVRMDDAINSVRIEAESIEVFLRSQHLSWDEGVPWVLASIEFTMSRLSSFGRNNLKEAPRDHKEAISKGLGACGNYVQLALDLINKSPAPVPCRSVQFYLHDEKNSKNSSHVGLEVFYGERWHFFDPYYAIAPVAAGNLTPSKILSAEETLNLLSKGTEPVCLGLGRPAMRIVCEETSIFPFAYFKQRPLDILYAAKGVIHLKTSADGSELSLSNMPTYVGRSLDYSGQVGDVKYAFDNKGHAARKLKFHVSATGGSVKEGKLRITVSGREVFKAALDKLAESKPIELQLSGPQDKLLMEVLAPADKQAYIVWKKIGVENLF